MQQDNWVKVHTSTFESEAQVIKDLLEASDMAAVVLNKRDSSYNNFGNCEIYVNAADAEYAASIIKTYFSVE